MGKIRAVDNHEQVRPLGRDMVDCEPRPLAQTREAADDIAYAHYRDVVERKQAFHALPDRMAGPGHTCGSGSGPQYGSSKRSDQLEAELIAGMLADNQRNM